MPAKNIYLPDDDLQTWEEAQRIAKRRRTSISKVIASLLEDYVKTYSGTEAMGLPPGFSVPASMKDPVLVAREELADDFRAIFLDWLKDREVNP